MNHRVISLKYRPQDFDELTGQSHVALSLKGAVRSGRVGHAYLFAGPRGVGKTTTARILAKSLNCIEGPTVHPCQNCQACREITLSRSIDVVEIDGASNRGIEEIRNLREAVRYSALHSRHKIYIIDEVHMLTQEAFNALLKTLEEPPPSVIFIFATTNPTKVPQTILSRCERFIFKRLSVREIAARLKSIAEREKIKITEKALHYLAIRADGSIRDGESILDQLASFVEDEITEEDVFKLVGFLGSEFYFDLLNKISKGDLAKVISGLNKGIEDGADPLEIYRGLTDYLRATLFVKFDLSSEFLDFSDEEIAALKNIQLDKNKIINMLDLVLHSEEMIKRSMNARVALELLLSQIALKLNESVENKNEVNVSDIKEKIFIALQKTSPKLAGVIKKADIRRDGNKIAILVENDFSKNQLLNSKGIIESVLREILKIDCSLNVQLGVASPKENDLVNTIKVLFDGEEMR